MAKSNAGKVIGEGLRDRLNLLIACGYPIFIIGQSVCWPVEAEDFFTNEEKVVLEGHILSGC